MSKERNQSFGGIKIRNTADINVNLFCELCKLILLNPIQHLCCGTRVCRWCSKKGYLNSEPFICPFCQTKQLERQVHEDRGVQRELNMINVECYSCSWHGAYSEYQEHLQEHHADLECSDCHERFATINAYEEHLQELCQYRSVVCELPGCNELVKYTEIQQHYTCDKHQLLLLAFIVSKKPLSSQFQPMQQELIAIRDSIIHLLSKIDILGIDCTRLKSERNEIKTTSERLLSQINDTSKRTNEITEKFHTLVQLQNESDKLLDNIKQSSLLIKSVLLDSDGTMIFPFYKRHDDFNVPFSIYSPIFKSSPSGYSFIFRVCSTIDSTDEYLSIFISLRRGDFDSIIFYPFPYNISICLYDHSGQGRHITSTIQHDFNSPAFARPTSEKNIEIGLVQFCPLNYLKDTKSIYLRNGVFFIRVFIDFLNTGVIPLK